MVDRINLLMKAKNVTARQFAEEIGIQPSGMSHILSGRNNPSLDFVMKVMKRWPEVNINWLMLGKGEMYAGVPLNVPQTSESLKPNPASTEQYDLFSQPISQQETIADDSYKVSRTVVEVADPPISEPHPGLENRPSQELSASFGSSPVKNPNFVQETEPHENRINESGQTSVPAQAILGKKKVFKVIVLYDDHSFSEYYPE